MTFIVPFEGEFCDKIRTIYSVNNDNPKVQQVVQQRQKNVLIVEKEISIEFMMNP